MNPYRPFLLPLLPETPQGKPVSVDRVNHPLVDSVHSPMEEEQQIAAQHGDAQACWERLRERLPEIYGIPLLSEWNGSVKRQETAVPGLETDFMRFLFLEDSGANWFLIEHPSAIELFDKFAGSCDRPALAKPSLFARLWRESDPTSAGNSIQVEEDSRPRANVERQALQRHIRDLLKKGNPSDWHLEPFRDGFRSRLRIHGKLVAAETLSRERGTWLQNALRAQAGIKEAKIRTACEGRLTLHLEHGPCMLRLSFVPVLYGQAMVARFLFSDTSPIPYRRGPEPDSRHWHEILAGYSGREGLWLVVGPTGSGKTTTCHALLRESVGNHEKILTAEDPVEQVISGVQQISLDPARGLTYARVMRAFLRQAPDTILVGEIRDEETASIAIQAGRTGHRILSTLHARDDPGVLRRLQDLDQNPDDIKPLLKMVLHQRLIPRLCPRCRLIDPVSPPWRDRIRTLGLTLPEKSARPAGCDDCQSGYNGRIAIFSSGNFLESPPVPRQLLQSAWPHVCAGNLFPDDCPWPIMGDPVDPFQLCHP